MLSIDEAKQAILKELPNGKIQGQVDFRNLYLFQVFTDDPGEEEMDPYFSVDKVTGAVRSFPILDNPNAREALALFTSNSKGGVK